jgi:hypothetical protein
MCKSRNTLAMVLVGAIGAPYLCDAIADPGGANGPNLPKAAFVLTDTGIAHADTIINAITGNEYRLTPPSTVRRPYGVTDTG